MKFRDYIEKLNQFALEDASILDRDLDTIYILEDSDGHLIVF